MYRVIDEYINGEFVFVTWILVATSFDYVCLNECEI